MVVNTKHISQKIEKKGKKGKDKMCLGRELAR